MSQKYLSGQRLLRAAGITLALLGLTVQGASAQEAVQETSAQAAESLTVVKDPITGKLRAPTAEEVAALKAKANATKRTIRAAPQAPKMIMNAEGYTGFRMTNESLSTSVAVRKPDGSIERQCLESHGEAGVAKAHVHTNQAVQAVTE